eukprot:14099-Amphidinium_carterae.1
MEQTSPQFGSLFTERIWCLRQPSTICNLICKGLWTEVMVVYSCLTAVVRGSFTTEVGFPGKDWLETMLAYDDSKPAVVDEAGASEVQAAPTLHADVLDEMKAFICARVDGASLEIQADASTYVKMLESWSSSLRAACQQREASKHARYSMRQLLHVFMASRAMRSSTQVRTAFQHMTEAIWPGLFRDVEQLGPSCSSARRAFALVDAAMILSSRRQNCSRSEQPHIYRWGFSDSSPIGGRDWFLSKHLQCSKENVIVCYLLATMLALDRPHFEHRLALTSLAQQGLGIAMQDLEYDGEACMPQPSGGESLQTPLTSEERSRMAGFLRHSLEMHVHIPTSLGQGASNLAHKASSLLHSIAVEVDTERDLHAYLNGCISWTSDLGTEKGLSSYYVVANTLLPSWWTWTEPAVQQQDEVACSFEHDGELGEDALWLHTPMIPCCGTGFTEEFGNFVLVSTDNPVVKLIHKATVVQFSLTIRNMGHNSLCQHAQQQQQQKQQQCMASGTSTMMARIIPILAMRCNSLCKHAAKIVPPPGPPCLDRLLLTCFSQAPVSGIYKRLVSEFGLSLAMHINNELGPFPDEADELSDGDDAGEEEEDKEVKLLPHSLHIPGICHVTHNALWEVTKHMESWEVWYSSLKNVAALLSNADRMRRVVAVIQESPLAHAASCFRRLAPALHEKRWSVVQDFLRIAYSQLLVLRQTWRAEMLSKTQSDSKSHSDSLRQFDAEAFANTLHDPFFFAYMRMVELVGSHLCWWTGWCEGCNCHEALAQNQDMSTSEKAQILATDLGFYHEGCPLQNMRMAELVACVLGYTDTSAPGSMGASDVIALEALSASAWVTDAIWSVVQRDYHQAKANIDLTMKIKLNFAASLPWMLAGLAHSNQIVVRKVAGACIHTFDGLSVAQQRLLPRYARKMLQVGSRTRTHLEEMVAGTLVCRYPNMHLLKHMALMRFSCLSERVIEAGHKDIKKGHGYNRFGPVSASVQVRMTTNFDKRLARQPSYFQDILAQMTRFTVKGEPMWLQGARLLHVLGHPALAKCVEARKANQTIPGHSWMQLCVQALYRCDTASTLRSLADVSASHEQRAGRLKNAVKRLLDHQEPVNLKDFAAATFANHLRKTLVEGAIISVPSCFAALCPLRPQPANDVAAVPESAETAVKSKHQKCNVMSVLQKFCAGSSHVNKVFPVQERRLFRVIHKNPSAFKQVPNAALLGGAIADDVLAVTEVMADQSASSSFTVHWHLRQSSAVHLLGGFTAADLAVLQEDTTAMYVWQPDVTFAPPTGAPATCIAECLHADRCRVPDFTKPLAFAEASTYDLIMQLVRDGWTQVATHSCNENGHTSLHGRETNAVPHGQTQAVYEKLLDGTPWHELKMSLAFPQHAGHLVHDWTYDGEAELNVTAMPGQSIASSPCLALENSALDDDDKSQSNASMDLAEDPGMDVDAVADTPVVHEQEGGDGKSTGAMDGTVHGDPYRAVLPLGAWGIWKLGRKKPNARYPFGGIECVCPLHAKSSATGCKKFIPLIGSSGDEMKAAVAMGKTWCIQD